MDQQKFDAFTRTLASGQSRRGLLKGLTGTAIGGLLAAVGIAEAGAKPKTNEPCTAPNTKCGKGKGKNAVCVNTQTDAANCGSCGNTCAATESCVGGQCECPAITCSGLETVNPGTCQCTCPHTTYDCTDPLVFNSSTCTCEGCPQGTEFCAGSQACDPVCDPGQVRNQTTCACECPIPDCSQIECGRVTNICGSYCQKTCGDGICVEGQCVANCTAPDCSQIECGRLENECGTCTKVCPDLRNLCVEGRCVEA
jgi:hypothetical protein